MLNHVTLHTGSFIVHIKSEGIYVDLAGYVEERLGTSDYEAKVPVSIGNNKRKIGLGKNELGEQ